MSELQNALEGSQPQDEQAESSPAVEAPVETPTQQVEPEQKPFDEHPRFKQLIEDRNNWRDLAMKTAKSPQPIQSAPDDPYAGMTPEERDFYRKMDERNEKIFEKKLAQVAPQFEQRIRDTQEAVVALSYERFQQLHPDVKAGSSEENAIAEKVQMGYPLEDAYKLVMFDKIRTDKQNQVKTAQTVKTQQKLAANVETQTIPTMSVKTKEKLSFRDMLKKQMEEANFTG